MSKNPHLSVPKKLYYLSSFWLQVITTGLVFIYITLNWRLSIYSHLALSLVFMSAALSCFRDKRRSLKQGSDKLSISLGVVLIGGVLVMSSIHGRGIFISLMPFLSALGIFLLISGIRSLYQYWQELIILFTLSIPTIIVPNLPDISPVTAKFSAFILWYLGSKVMLKGMHIVMPNGSVEVVEGCSGSHLIAFMLGLSVVYLVMFPTHKIIKFVAPVFAACLGFIVNGVRVALLAILATKSNSHGFEYWHSNEGSLIFSVISVIFFGIFCLFHIRTIESKTS